MLEKLVDAAFEYAFPLYEFGRTRYQAVEDMANVRRHPPNTVQHEHTVQHERHLSDQVRFRDDHGQLLDGRKRYLLHVPPTGIPNDSFWSFSMYEPTPDGQRFFVENPIRRYSIGNRTRGIALKEDGSLDIALQRDEPSDAALRANWLPTPAGTFQVALRTYMPRADLREGRAAMPTIFSR